MWTAPAPTSNDGSGNHMPLRAKMPNVGIVEDFLNPVAQLVLSSVAHQYGWSLLMLVNENSVENWKPEKPRVSAGARLRGANTTPSSEVSERNCWLSGTTPGVPVAGLARRASTRSLSSARAAADASRSAHATGRALMASRRYYSSLRAGKITLATRSPVTIQPTAPENMAPGTRLGGTAKITQNPAEVRSSAAAFMRMPGSPCGGAVAACPPTSCSSATIEAMPNTIDRNTTRASMSLAPPETRFLCTSSSRPVVSAIPGTSKMMTASTMTSRTTSGKTALAPQAM